MFFKEILSKFPSRNSLLDKEKTRVVHDKISKSQPILFYPNDIYDAPPFISYHIIAYGILENGEKCVVLINNIRPYFDIFSSETKALEALLPLATGYEDLFGKEFKYFSEEQIKFTRLYFENPKQRKDALTMAREMNCQTFSDEYGKYYNIACRNHLKTLSQWTELSNYSYDVNNSNYKLPVFNVDIKNYNKYEEALNQELLYDKTMVVGWDIETWSPDRSVPRHDKKLHRIINIGVSAFWYYDQKPLVRACIVEKPIAETKNFIFIKCKDEKEMILAFATILEKLQPDFLIGFNDSYYDWPWIFNRAKKHGIFKDIISLMSMRIISKHKLFDNEENLIRYHIIRPFIKMEANYSKQDGEFVYVPGCIPADVRTIFTKLYPKLERSRLEDFLKELKLQGKVDMPYKRIFGAYDQAIRFYEGEDVSQSLGLREIEEKEEDLLITLRDIAEYCVIDAERCQALFFKRKIIIDKRGVSDLAYCSVYDAFYRADGSKVRNLVMARGSAQGIFFTTNVKKNFDSDDKYPGAYVIQPAKNLYTSKLTITERIKKAKQDSPWLRLSPAQIEDAHRAIAAGQNDIAAKIAPCIAEFINEKTFRPLVALDFSSLYPSIIMAKNLSPEYLIVDEKKAQFFSEKYKLHPIKFEYGHITVQAWTVEHENKIDKSKSDFRFGIYPAVLKELFDKRAILKKELKERKIELEAAHKSHESLDKIEDITYRFEYLNSKQTALKVFMNTFYGEAGNKKSPFFFVEIAGGTTSFGQQCLKNAVDRARELKCNVYYGDTDSMYISVSEDIFTEIDRKYFGGELIKIDYWTKMVELTKAEGNRIKDIINAWFERFTNSKFLSMAYEEVLFPVALTGKKMYYGIEHAEIINFNPKDGVNFIKGLTLKKRGASEIMRNVSLEIMRKSLDVNNIYDIKELIIEIIDEIYTRKWNIEDFIQTASYKPSENGKQGNIFIKTFVDRMKEHGIIITPHERFQYIVAKKYPFKYDFRGRKEKISGGDKIELVDEFTKNGMEIDMEHYMDSIAGQFARFLSIHPDFSRYEDKESVEYAKKFISSYYKSKHKSSYEDQGPIYKNAFKVANKTFKERIKGPQLKTVISMSYDLEEIRDWLLGRAMQEVEKKLKKSSFMDRYIMRVTEQLSIPKVFDTLKLFVKNGPIDQYLHEVEKLNKPLLKNAVELFRFHTKVMEKIKKHTDLKVHQSSIDPETIRDEVLCSIDRAEHNSKLIENIDKFEAEFSRLKSGLEIIESFRLIKEKLREIKNKHTKIKFYDKNILEKQQNKVIDAMLKTTIVF